MHMADALLSPATGGVMWAVSAGAIACCSRTALDERKVPLMGVLGAFIFAVQMINFTLPGTGSSGHLGGGLLLAILLGPPAAFLTIASVLVVQALFFADGGLLALGCNIFNLGLLPAFVAYPLCYRPFVGSGAGRVRSTAFTIVAAVVGLELGAVAVVLETAASGIAELPLSTFLLFMLPVHLAIGIVEGTITAAVVAFVRTARPDLVEETPRRRRQGARLTVFAFFAAFCVIAGWLTWYASEKPDGLEWAISRVTGREMVAPRNTPTHDLLARLQERVALFPGYESRPPSAADTAGTDPPPQPSSGTSTGGFVGGLITLGIAGLLALVLRRRRRQRQERPH